MRLFLRPCSRDSAALAVQKTSQLPERVIVDHDVFRVGRTVGANQLVIEDAKVSGQHCELRREGEAFRVRDCESRNGIRVNGHRVAERLLKSGDRLQIGRVEFRVEIESDAAGEPAANKPAPAGRAEAAAPESIATHSAAPEPPDADLSRDPSDEPGAAESAGAGSASSRRAPAADEPAAEPAALPVTPVALPVAPAAAAKSAPATTATATPAPHLSGRRGRASRLAADRVRAATLVILTLAVFWLVARDLGRDTPTDAAATPEATAAAARDVAALRETQAALTARLVALSAQLDQLRVMDPNAATVELRVRLNELKGELNVVESSLGAALKRLRAVERTGQLPRSPTGAPVTRPETVPAANERRDPAPTPSGRRDPAPMPPSPPAPATNRPAPAEPGANSPPAAGTSAAGTPGVPAPKRPPKRPPTRAEQSAHLAELARALPRPSDWPREWAWPPEVGALDRLPGKYGPAIVPGKPPGSALDRLPSLPDDPKERQKLIDAAIDQGAAWLYDQLEQDGRFRNVKRLWFHSNPSYVVGANGLGLLALVRSGYTRKKPKIAKALARLKKDDTDSLTQRGRATYTAGILLMLLEALGQRRVERRGQYVFETQQKLSPADLAWMRRITDDLAGGQGRSGVWSYQANGRRPYGDNSNTQFAALGLKAAARSGITIAPKVWQRLLAQFVDSQEVSGPEVPGFVRFARAGRASSGADATSPLVTMHARGWSYSTYRPGMTRAGPAQPARALPTATASMSAAGVSTLGVALSECEKAWDAGRLARDPTLRGKGQQALADGLAWLSYNYPIPPGGWGFYALYGLERACVLTGTARLGERDWYNDGARYLLGKQMDTGAWNTQLNTCYALLFLTRGSIRLDRLPIEPVYTPENEPRYRDDNAGPGPGPSPAPPPVETPGPTKPAPAPAENAPAENAPGD